MLSNHKRVEELKAFYAGKNVVITGIQGFKGSWLAALLHELGAEVVGIGVQQEEAVLYPLMNFEEMGINSYDFDINSKVVSDIIAFEEPDILFHLAAQPIVSVGYEDPYTTYLTNVMGTLNIFEGVRKTPKKMSIVNITTDKVYRNYEKSEGYKEDEELMGSDPYSSSKSCSEILSYSYNESYFKNDPNEKILSTVRAGNVIGGGDFAANRIVPDIVRALKNKSSVSIRNFDSVRPYQHVLDAVFAYVILAKEQYENPVVAGAYNIGPNPESIMKTKEISDFAHEKLKVEIIDASNGEKFHETNILTLDSSKFRETFDWAPEWETKEKILNKTFIWYLQWINGYNVNKITTTQIKEFLHVSKD